MLNILITIYMWNMRMIAKPFYSIKSFLTIMGFSLLFFTTTVYSQNNTSSPYSYFGLGELSQSGSGNNISMGGTS